MTGNKQEFLKKAKEKREDYISKKRMSKVQCLGCGEVLISEHVHDFQRCSCANQTFVDGGAEYCRYGGMSMGKILLFNRDGSSYIADKRIKRYQ